MKKDELNLEEEMNQKNTKELQGQSIRLVPLSEKAINFVCDVESDKSLWLYEENVEDDKSKLKAMYTERIDDLDYYDFIICLTEDGTPIGVANIWCYVERRRSWEIGYGILKAYQNKGYGKESVRLLLKFAFEHLKAHKVVAMCNANNLSSSKIMEANGMRKEGIFKEELFWEGDWVDQWFYAILDKEAVCSNS